MKLKYPDAKKQDCKHPTYPIQRRQFKNKKTIQLNNLNKARTFIASSGRCCLSPFHHGLAPLQPLQRKTRKKTTHFRKTKCGNEIKPGCLMNQGKLY